VGKGGAGAPGGSPHAGYLFGVLVLLVTLGILGMHALTSGHMAHGLVPHATPSIVGTPSAHSAGHVVPPAADVLPAVATAVASSPSIVSASGWAATCDGGCHTGSASMVCLAVLALLLHLLLGRSHLRTHRLEGRRSGACGAPRGRPRAGPSLHVLCISRT